MKNPLHIRRRSFLLGAGGAALAIPLLPSLLGRGRAQPRVAKSFISYRITNGHFGHMWYPTDEQAAGLTMVEPNVREMRISDIPGPISTLLDERFDPFRDRMNLFRHIDRLDKGDHGPENGLFGWSTKDEDRDDIYGGLPPSIDRLIAQHAFSTPYVPLNLSVRWSSEGQSCSVTPTSAGTLAIEPGLYPQQAFQHLFGDLEVDESTADRRRRQRRSVVDRVLPHYRSVRDNPRLSARDRALLDEHIEHMDTISVQLGRSAAACSAPERPAEFRRRPEDVDAAAQAQIDITVAALRCGLTRVVNLYLDPDTIFDASLHGVDGGHHGASHNSDPASVTSVENAHHWHMRYLSELLTQLDGSVDPESGENLLDSSLVLVNNEIGNQNGRSGNQPDDIDLNHIGLDIQCMTVGGASGALRTGHFLDYRTDYTRGRWSQYIGTAYNRLLVTCMLAMGLTPEAWEVDGTAGYGDMRGAKYDMTPLDQVVIGDMRAMLPGLSAA
jgi:hypothetical protein